MSEAIRWWLVLQLAGAATLPLCLLAFARLPDRGYALSKPFALIVLGFTFWFFSSDNFIAVLPNSAGGILGALFVLAAISVVAAYLRADELIGWAREHWLYIAGVELMLLIVFAVAVALRSVVGQIAGTEQPMDLMFLNSTIRAEHFPPEDPWLSGHTVAYYYFGYLISDRRHAGATQRRRRGRGLQHRSRDYRDAGARRRVRHRLQPHPDRRGGAGRRSRAVRR
jgi:uncharacterized membrane protein